MTAITNTNGIKPKTMSSREIAELVDARHNDVEPRREHRRA